MYTLHRIHNTGTQKFTHGRGNDIYKVIIITMSMNDSAKGNKIMKLTKTMLTPNTVRCTRSLLRSIQIVMFICNEHPIKFSCIFVGTIRRCGNCRRTGHLRVFWWSTWIRCVAWATLSTASFTRSRCRLQIFVFLLDFQWVTTLQFFLFTINIFFFLSKCHTNIWHQIYNIQQ